jgi:hypothetical protein
MKSWPSKKRIPEFRSVTTVASRLTPTPKERAVAEVSGYVDNAGFQAWNMSKGIAAARDYAGQARELLVEFDAADDTTLDRAGEAGRIVEEIERIAAGGNAVWERIEAALVEAGLVDLPEGDATMIRNGGAQPELTHHLWEIWRDFEGRTAGLALLRQLEEITSSGHSPSDHLWRLQTTEQPHEAM